MKLSKQAQQCIVKLFQKGIWTQKDVSPIFNQLDFQPNETLVADENSEYDCELDVTNPELVLLTPDEINLVAALSREEVKA